MSGVSIRRNTRAQHKTSSVQDKPRPGSPVNDTLSTTRHTREPSVRRLAVGPFIGGTSALGNAAGVDVGLEPKGRCRALHDAACITWDSGRVEYDIDMRHCKELGSMTQGILMFTKALL